VINPFPKAKLLSDMLACLNLRPFPPLAEQVLCCSKQALDYTFA